MLRESLRVRVCIIMLASTLVLALCLFGCSGGGTNLDKVETFYGLTYSVSSKWVREDPSEYELDDGSDIAYTDYHSSDDTLEISVTCSNTDLDETTEDAIQETVDAWEDGSMDVDGYTFSDIGYSKVRDFTISGTEGAIYEFSYVLSEDAVGGAQMTVKWVIAYIMDSQMHYEIDVTDISDQSNALPTLEAILDTVSVNS